MLFGHLSISFGEMSIPVLCPLDRFLAPLCPSDKKHRRQGRVDSRRQLCFLLGRTRAVAELHIHGASAVTAHPATTLCFMQLCRHLPLGTIIPVLPSAQPRQHHLATTGGCACDKPPPHPASLPQRLNHQIENQPGCPLHPSVLTSDVLNLALGNGIKVDFHQRPQEVGVGHHAFGGFPVEFFVAFHDEDAFADRLHLLRGLSKGPGGETDTYEDRTQDLARIWP